MLSSKGLHRGVAMRKTSASKPDSTELLLVSKLATAARQTTRCGGILRAVAREVEFNDATHPRLAESP